MTQSVRAAGEIARHEAAAVQKVADFRTREAIGRAWRAAGHTPYRHLQQVSGEGDPKVLEEFYARERYGSHTALPNHLAQRDIEDIGHAIRLTRHRILTVHQE